MVLYNELSKAGGDNKMKIVPITPVPKPNNHLDKEIEALRQMAKKRHSVPSSTVVHIGGNVPVSIGYEHLYTYRCPKMTKERVLAHIEMFKNL